MISSQRLMFGLFLVEIAASASGEGPIRDYRFQRLNGRRVAWKHWYGMEEPSPHRMSADCPPSTQGKPWGFLQGLSKYMHLKVETQGIPRFFAARPERFFVPPVEALADR